MRGIFEAYGFTDHMTSTTSVVLLMFDIFPRRTSNIERPRWPPRHNAVRGYHSRFVVDRLAGVRGSGHTTPESMHSLQRPLPNSVRCRTFRLIPVAGDPNLDIRMVVTRWGQRVGVPRTWLSLASPSSNCVRCASGLLSDHCGAHVLSGLS